MNVWKKDDLGTYVGTIGEEEDVAHVYVTKYYDFAAKIGEEEDGDPIIIQERSFGDLKSAVIEAWRRRDKKNRPEIEVPMVTLITGEGYKRITVRGVHASRRNVALVTIDGKKETREIYKNFYPNISDEVLSAWNAAYWQYLEAERNLKALVVAPLYIPQVHERITAAQTGAING